jgi:hypothetical protein
MWPVGLREPQRGGTASYLLVALEPRREGKIMKGSWYLLGFLLVGLVFALPNSAQSDRPECPSNNPGACFVEELGFFVGTLRDGDGDIVVVFNQSGDGQNWERVLPDGTIALHSRGEREMNFCPAGVATLSQCQRLNPPRAVFSGTGRVSAVAVSGGSECPTTVHIRGTGTNGFGESMEFTGHYVQVRDSNSGQCRTITLEVEGTPLP